MNIVLTGFMASGKSTVGKRLAEIMGYEFADTDSLVEAKEDMKISEIFEQFGERYFRDLEKTAVEEVSVKDNIVIATGGGVVLDEDNMVNLRKNGVIINLSPDEDVIKSRLLGDKTRPLAANSDFEEILERFEKRKPFYDNCDYQIKVTLDTDVDGVCEIIKDFLKR